MLPKIKFCGGAQTVTGSMHLVQTEQSRVLLDCGLFQGHRQDFYAVNNTFAFDLAKINAMTLSHAHIDHSGNIPNIVKRGLKVPIFATIPTVDLCQLMLPDSGHIQEEDIKFVNKINQRKRLPPVEPLYTGQDALDCLPYFQGVSYRQDIKISPDITARFLDSGHVLGSAITVLNLKISTNGSPARTIRLAYAVDLGRPNLPLLNDPETPGNIDYLIIESTYGDRLHDHIETAKGKLADAVNRTFKRNGKLIIPSFALERTQEVIYYLSELIQAGKIPAVPIYVDSPLATNITKVFQQHIDYLDAQTQKELRLKEDPFGFGRVRYVRSVEESKQLNFETKPMIIISASGMCEAGRILHHLKNNIENPANTILIVGYMAENTLGKKIVDRQPIVKIFGDEYHLRAEVVKINAFSAHADKNDLIAFINKCRPQLKRVFLVHGDMDQAAPFRDYLNKSGINAYLPAKNEEVTLG